MWLVGIDMVWVHGTPVLDNGRLIAPHPFPGRVLTSPFIGRLSCHAPACSRIALT